MNGELDPSLAWAILGLTLVIIELVSGTFYLLMLGAAAFGAAGTHLGQVGWRPDREGLFICG